MRETSWTASRSPELSSSPHFTTSTPRFTRWLGSLSSRRMILTGAPCALKTCYEAAAQEPARTRNEIHAGSLRQRFCVQRNQTAPRFFGERTVVDL